MTIRRKDFSIGSQCERITFAGPRAELRALALEWAAGQHGARKDEIPHFERAARDLADGDVTAGTDRVRFWCDAPDGTPFCGPREYRPDHE